MADITCDVCMDLLPLVQDGIASEDSKRLVEEHIKNCSACAKLYDIKAVPAVNSEKIFMKFKRKAQAFFAILIMFGLFFGLGLTDGREMFYNSLIMPVIGVLGYIVFSFVKNDVKLVENWVEGLNTYNQMKKNSKENNQIKSNVA